MKIILFGGAALAAALALVACGKKPATEANGAAPAPAGVTTAAPDSPAAAPPATVMAETPELRAAGSAVEAVVRAAYASPLAAIDASLFVEETGKAFAAAPAGKFSGDWRFDGATGATAAPTFYGVNVTSATTAKVNADYKVNGVEGHTNWDLCKVGDRWLVRDVNSRSMYTVRQTLGLSLTGGC